MTRPTETALGLLRQAGRVVCDASQENDTDTLRRVMVLVESARVALAEGPAAPAAPRRSAEEIAREMVSDPVKNRGGLWEFSILADADNRVVVDNYTDREGAELDVEAMRRSIARLYERGRADGATAALAAQQPRDLAGRLHALVTAKTGEWADVVARNKDAFCDEACAAESALYHVRATYADLIANGSMSSAHVEEMRREDRRGPVWTAALRKTADEIEAIVRETAGEQQR